MHIVEVGLRQGLVHPITCVPDLIALETDTREWNSKLAHHLWWTWMKSKMTHIIIFCDHVNLVVPTSETSFQVSRIFWKPRWPSDADQKKKDGLQMSYIFIKSMAGSSEYSENPKVQLEVPDSMKGVFGSSSFNYARLGISRIYELIRGNRVSRNKSMSSVVRKFDTPMWNHAAIPFLMWVFFFFALVRKGIYIKTGTKRPSKQTIERL